MMKKHRGHAYVVKEGRRHYCGYIDLGFNVAEAVGNTGAPLEVAVSRRIDVHGGVTYIGSNCTVIGFDTGHFNDYNFRRRGENYEPLDRENELSYEAVQQASSKSAHTRASTEEECRDVIDQLYRDAVFPSELLGDAL